MAVFMRRSGVPGGFSCRDGWGDGVMALGLSVRGGCGVKGGSLDCVAVAKELEGEVDYVMIVSVLLVAKEVLLVMVMS